ncbi:unnamed protein product, partial [Closterium sp. NIES-53]
SPPQLLPGSSLLALAPHTEVTESLIGHREHEAHVSTPVRARRFARPRPPAVPSTHGMALRPSSVPPRVILPELPASSLPHVLDPESDLARVASPTVTRLLATVVTDPDLECTTAFALVTELVDFAARTRLDYVTSLVTESESVCPPSVGGEPALSSDVLEDRLFELQCLVAALPRFPSKLLWPEGDPDALDIPTPRSYAEAITVEPPRPLYSLRQAPREWHETQRTTLAALGIAPSSADPSLFLRIDTNLPPFYLLVYVLQRFGFQFSSPQPTPLSTGHSLSAPPSDDILARYVAPDRHRKGSMVLTGHSDASWADDQMTQRSSQGYTFSLCYGSVSWRFARSSSVLGSKSSIQSDASRSRWYRSRI